MVVIPIRSVVHGDEQAQEPGVRATPIPPATSSPAPAIRNPPERSDERRDAPEPIIRMPFPCFVGPMTPTEVENEHGDKVRCYELTLTLRIVPADLAFIMARTGKDLKARVEFQELDGDGL